MHFVVITLFPEQFSALTQAGVTGRAVQQGLVEVAFINPRDFATDAHRTIDDRPYGGGPGMVMMAEPIARAIEAAKQQLCDTAPVIYLSPQGRPLDHQWVQQACTASKQYILLCGRYEGVDERVIAAMVDQEISIGDYVLSGGELPAMVLMDAMMRLVPGVLGDDASAAQDSFAQGSLDCPHYTRPEVWRDMAVPEVLLSGHHEKIQAWRDAEAKARTEQRRPDLFEKK